jgi:hypothetical protein
MYYLATLSGSATFQANAIHIQAENSKRANWLDGLLRNQQYSKPRESPARGGWAISTTCTPLK